MNVILASSSPRRREIMSILTDDFICIPPDINEIAPSDIELELKPQYIATQKAKYISKGHRDAMVIGCDTSVIIDGKILNKPVNTEHARRMLRLLSGNTHKVITGCCINYRGLERCFSVSTEVEFFELTENEIEHLLQRYKDAPLGMQAEVDDFRISLAGAQEKTALQRVFRSHLVSS